MPAIERYLELKLDVAAPLPMNKSPDSLLLRVGIGLQLGRIIFRLRVRVRCRGRVILLGQGSLTRVTQLPMKAALRVACRS